LVEKRINTHGTDVHIELYKSQLDLSTAKSKRYAGDKYPPGEMPSEPLTTQY